MKLSRFHKQDNIVTLKRFPYVGLCDRLLVWATTQCAPELPQSYEIILSCEPLSQYFSMARCKFDVWTCILIRSNEENCALPSIIFHAANKNATLADVWCIPVELDKRHTSCVTIVAQGEDSILSCEGKYSYACVTAVTQEGAWGVPS